MCHYKLKEVDLAQKSFKRVLELVSVLLAHVLLLTACG
jgi:hypothetical protein